MSDTKELCALVDACVDAASAAEYNHYTTKPLVERAKQARAALVEYVEELERENDDLEAVVEANQRLRYECEQFYVAKVRGMEAERDSLRARCAECERSLDMYDLGGDSEYWLRYPVPAAVDAALLAKKP